MDRDRMATNVQTTDPARQSLASEAEKEGTLREALGRAVVLVGHGGVPRDYPRASV
jgi:hypothetical protein